MSLAARTGAAGVVIRRATGADIEPVAAIERSLFGDPWSRRSFADLLTYPHVVFLVAEDGGGVVSGYAVVIVAGEESELANLAVAREVHRAGIGRSLLSAAMQAAKARGALEIYLEVRVSNAPAIGLYESAGFVAVGRRPRYYARPAEDALIMRAGTGGAVVGGSAGFPPIPAG